VQRRGRLPGRPLLQAAPARHQGGRYPPHPCPRPQQPLLPLHLLLLHQQLRPLQQLAAQAWAAGLRPPLPPSAAWEGVWAAGEARRQALPQLPVQLLAQPRRQPLAPLLGLPL
jgi:hypothetical protein